MAEKPKLTIKFPAPTLIQSTLFDRGDASAAFDKKNHFSKRFTKERAAKIVFYDYLALLGGGINNLMVPFLGTMCSPLSRFMEPTGNRWQAPATVRPEGRGKTNSVESGALIGSERLRHISGAVVEWVGSSGGFYHFICLLQSNQTISTVPWPHPHTRVPSVQ